MDLDGKVSLVTGAASGIGRATAMAFAEEGAKVSLFDRNSEELSKLVKELGPDRAIVRAGNVTSAEDLRQCVADTLAKWQRLDVLVVNAGINGTWAPIDELSVDDWRETIDINLTGSFLTIQAAVPALKRQGGSIVVMASVNGTRIFSNTGATAYACSKAAQVALANMLALELARDSIRVNTICPGATLTPIHGKTEKHDLAQIQTPVEYPEGSIPLSGGDLADPKQVADVAAFLVSERASHVTGTVVYVDGGESLLKG